MVGFGTFKTGLNLLRFQPSFGCHPFGFFKVGVEYRFRIITAIEGQRQKGKVAISRV